MNVLTKSIDLAEIHNDINSDDNFISSDDNLATTHINLEEAPDTPFITLFDDDGLLELLKSWGMETHFVCFHECGVKYADVQYLNQSDIGEMFPGRENIGLRARLRENLFFFKKSQGISQGSTVNDSGVCEWFDKCREFFKPESPSMNSPMQISSKSSLGISVREILQSSDMGRNIIQYYAEHGMLDEKKRDDIISCIVEHFYDPILKTYKVPDPKKMNQLAESIINIFPNENLDIYYIPRNKTRNPSGRLFNKFVRLNRKSKCTIDVEVNSKQMKIKGNNIEKENHKNAGSQEMASIEVDNEINTEEMEILKNKIQLVSEKDNSARDIWARSYNLRRKEILKNNTPLFNILREWPYFKSSIGDTFIDYDFGVEYPKSQLTLFRKWDNLLCELRPIFLDKLKDKHYKLLYNDIIINKFDKDTANYIQIAALNCILRPTLRHHHKITSIKDAVNSMITHLYAINDLERFKFEKQNEASSSKTTIQPFILVVGPSPTCIKEFYIVLDKFTLKCNSFLTALDICFKCFQVFNLVYPKESELVWQWIQNYIYEITTENDKKSSALAEFYLILKNNQNDML